MKHNFIRRSLIAILCYASMLTFSTHGAQAAPSLKSQLYTAVSNASANWPKIGSYRVADSMGSQMATEIYFYNDQIKYTTQRMGSNGSKVWYTMIVEPNYSYAVFNSDSLIMQNIVKKLNVKRIDWIRYNVGYNTIDPSGSTGIGEYKRFLNLPIYTLNTAYNNSQKISYNAKSRLWVIEGKCATQKCTTYVTFNPNGSIKTLGQNFADNTSGWFEFNTTKPTGYFVEQSYVLDNSTGNIAKY